MHQHHTALFLAPPPRCKRRGRPRKYGARLTPEQVGTLPVKRSAQILYRQLEIVRYRTCCCVARFLNGAVVRVVWVELERPDRPGRRPDTWLLLCTDPTLPPLEVIRSYAKRWAVEALFRSLKTPMGAEGRLSAAPAGVAVVEIQQPCTEARSRARSRARRPVPNGVPGAMPAGASARERRPHPPHRPPNSSTRVITGRIVGRSRGS